MVGKKAKQEASSKMQPAEPTASDCFLFGLLLDLLDRVNTYL
jgi:hypothetical protein